MQPGARLLVRAARAGSGGRPHGAVRAAGARTGAADYQTRRKTAPTARSPVIVTTQVGAVPEHAPVHSAKTEPRRGRAVGVTRVPASHDSEQSRPHRMPGGSLTTTLLARQRVPATATDNV